MGPQMPNHNGLKFLSCNLVFAIERFALGRARYATVDKMDETCQLRKFRNNFDYIFTTEECYAGPVGVGILILSCVKVPLPPL